MSDDLDPVQDATRRFVRGLCELTDWTPTELARAADLAPSTLNRFLNSREAKHTLSQRSLLKLVDAAEERIRLMASEGSGMAQILSNSAEFIRWAEAHSFPLQDRLDALIADHDAFDRGDPNTVTVIGHVQAGDWREAILWDPEDRYPSFAPATGWLAKMKRQAFEVRGDSMDELYPPGTILVTVSLIEINRDPRPGEKVIVNRRDKHGFIEATVKEYQVDSDGNHWLVPRSSNPAHKTPIRLEPNGDGEDDVRVTALVVGSYKTEALP